MRKLSTQLAILPLLTFSSLVLASTKYALDSSHSTVSFKIAHLMISSVHGRFDTFEGTFSFDEKTGKVEDLNAKIDLDTINTNDAKRDGHLKSEDFFGVRSKDGKLAEEKRWMTFKATKVSTKNNKPTAITGDLSLNGITKPITLKINYKGAATDPWGNARLGFEATGALSRKNYGITWNKALEAGGVVVGDEVAITIDGEAIAEKTTVK